MSWLARPRTMTPIVSRLASRCDRARAGIGGVSARLIATFAAAAIVCAVHAALCPERTRAVTDAVRAMSSAASLAAIDAAVAHRAAFESRSSSRWPSSVDVLVASVAETRRVLPVGFRPAFAGVSDVANDPVLARGYDAAAPPALS